MLGYGSLLGNALELGYQAVHLEAFGDGVAMGIFYVKGVEDGFEGGWRLGSVAVVERRDREPVPRAVGVLFGSL